MKIEDLKINQIVRVVDSTLGPLLGQIIGLGDLFAGCTPSENPDYKIRVLVCFKKDYINSILSKYTADQRMKILSEYAPRDKDCFATKDLCWAYKIDSIEI